MAKSKNNVLTHGLSGKIGDLLVFSQRGGKTVVSKIPQSPTSASEGQKKQRQRFQHATIYAKSALGDPPTKERYDAAAKKKKKGSAYNVAVADFFNAPDIHTVDLADYTGAAGDPIRMIVSDDFAVKSVHVRILKADGSLVEEGMAVNTAESIWIYTAAQNNESLEGDKIIITASDLPGNLTTEERDI